MKAERGAIMFKLFKILVFLAIDVPFAYMLIVTAGKIGGGYTLLFLAIVVWLTWEIVRAIKE